MMLMPYLDLWSMLLSGQVSYTSNSSHLFWNLKGLVLVQTVSYRKKITYHRLCIGLHWWHMVAYALGAYVALNVALELPLL